MATSRWKVFELQELKARVRGPEPRFFEFLGGGRLSGAVYRLPAGAHDLQGPHLEDEVYVVLEGRAKLLIGTDRIAVAPGMLVFIEANTGHSFLDIEEDLTLLALFSASQPPYG